VNSQGRGVRRQERRNSETETHWFTFRNGYAPDTREGGMTPKAG